MSRLASFVAALWAAGLVAPAHAAMRVCLDEVSSGLQVAGTEPEARRQAIEAWMGNARSAGVESPAWRTAIGKHLACAKADDGRLRCLAKAAPCIITHKPLPPGSFEPWKPKGIGG